MINVLCIDSDSVKTDAFKRFFDENSGYSYRTVSERDSFEGLCVDKTDIVLFTVADDNDKNVVTVIRDVRPACKVVFLYNSDLYLTALDLFNGCHGSYMLNMDIASDSDACTMISTLTASINEENRLDALKQSISEKENVYKLAMRDMSELLNARVECYSDISQYVLASISMMLPDSDYKSSIIDFLKEKIELYIYYFLSRKVNISDIFKEPQAYFAGKRSNLNLSFNSRVPAYDSDSWLRISYILELLADTYSEFSDSSVGRVDISMIDNIYKVDVVFESVLAADTAGNGMNIIKPVVDGIVEGLSDKSIIKNKDCTGYYRLYFV